jgi:hypothetical protein
MVLHNGGAVHVERSWPSSAREKRLVTQTLDLKKGDILVSSLCFRIQRVPLRNVRGNPANTTALYKAELRAKRACAIMRPGYAAERDWVPPVDLATVGGCKI